MSNPTFMQNIEAYKARMRLYDLPIKRILLVVPETGGELVGWALSRDYAEMIVDRQSNPLKYRIREMKP